MNELVHYNAARTALSTACTIDDAKQIRDKAEALKAYARQRSDVEMERWVAEIKLRATVRIGELSSELDGAKNQHALPNGGKSKSNVLKEAGISTSAAQRAEQLAANHADVEQYIAEQAAQQKPVTIDAALKRVERIARDRKSEQSRVEKARFEAAMAGTEVLCNIKLGDFREVLADVSNVNAIITDPPYPKEFLPLLSDLAAFADRVLTEDGVLAVLMGQTHLPEVYRRLDGGRPYRWTCCYLTPGQGYASHSARVQTNWKPVLLYGGGPRLTDIFRAENANDTAKANHKWGQDFNAFCDLVERLTNKGDTIVDPFCGAGTTLLAAYSKGRHSIGADIDPQSVATSRQRIFG